MTSEMITLDQALRISEQLSLTDQLRLIGLLSERLRHEMDRGDDRVDMLSLAGLGAELWQEIDVAAYLEQAFVPNDRRLAKVQEIHVLLFDDYVT
jgi:hypothetical protein